MGKKERKMMETGSNASTSTGEALICKERAKATKRAGTDLHIVMVPPMSTKCPSPSSSPPTPPSPLPISVGPGHHRYLFSPSPSLSPPFSASSEHSSPETVPLLRWASPAERPREPSAFSLDKPWEDPSPPRPWSFKDWIRRLLLRCCCFCCPSLPQADQEEELSSLNAVELNSEV